MLRVVSARVSSLLATFCAKCLVKLATTIHDHHASNLDSTPDVAQLRTIAEEGGVELKLQVAQIREFFAGFASLIEGHAAHEDGIESCARGPSMMTKH